MKSYIWTLPTRIFHGLLAIGFTAAYILGDFGNLRNLHYAFGAFVGTLIVFRLLFGMVGPKYSNFKDFPIGFKSLNEFRNTYFSKTKTYAGHNPAASVVMLCILLVGLLCGASGYLLYATENNILNLGVSENILEELHEVLATLFLLLIAMHLLGILADSIFHRQAGTFQSIFTGYKNVETKSASLNGFHKVFVLFWLIVPFYVFYLAYGLQTNGNHSEDRDENTELYEHNKDESFG